MSSGLPCAARRRIARTLLWTLGLPFALLLVSQPGLVFGSPGPAPDNGAYFDPGNKHGNTSGVNRLPLPGGYPQGSCEHCHSEHTVSNNFGLFAANDNNLCYTCHNGPGADPNTPWPGSGTYGGSGHGFPLVPDDYPSGSLRSTSLCVQCHNPHGNKNAANGLFPSLLDYLEEGGAGAYTLGGCYSNASSAGQGCHGNVAGNRPTNARDIYSEFLKTSKHPLSLATKKHVATESRAINSGAFSGANRHVECVDCHNPHRAVSGIHAPPGNGAGGVLRGAWGVQPAFGGALPNVPTGFTVRTFTGAVGEQESWLCYKCHSYFAFGLAPVGTDVAGEFNTANASHHGVEGTITLNSYTIATAINGNLETMEAPWQTGGAHKIMTCSDCHRSDNPADPAGPHGSANTYILRAATGTTYANLDNAFCLLCHKASVYTPSPDPGTNETGSRFDRQSTGDNSANHSNHVVSRGFRCRYCHAGSGAINNGANENPVPGSVHGTNAIGAFMNGINIQVYNWPSNGSGECITDGCHPRKSWTPPLPVPK